MSIFQSALRMLRADHLNIDGPPFPAKFIRKFRSALGGEVTYRDRDMCVYVYVCKMYEERILCIFCTHQKQTSDQEQTHSISTVSFGFGFKFVILVNLRIDPKIMRVAFVRFWRWKHLESFKHKQKSALSQNIIDSSPHFICKVLKIQILIVRSSQ